MHIGLIFNLDGHMVFLSMKDNNWICFRVNIFVLYLMRTILILLLVVACFAVEAQSRKQKKGTTAKVQENGMPTSVEPNYPQKQYAPKKSSRKKGAGPTYESEQEYYQRMAQLNKTKRKNERMLETPQYIDPTYFGHKRPPKKRPPGKMKYCKECGLRH